MGKNRWGPYNKHFQKFWSKSASYKSPLYFTFFKFLKIIFSEDGETFQELGSRSIYGHVWAATLPNYNGRPMVVGGCSDQVCHKKSELLDLNKKEWEETTEYPWGT